MTSAHATVVIRHETGAQTSVDTPMLAAQGATSEVQNTPPQWVVYGAPFFTGFAAIIAATLAAVVALRSIKASRENLIEQITAQRQIAARASRATVVSANRQKWIDGLRDDLAEFLAADFVILDIYGLDEDDLSESEQVDNRKQVAEAKRDRRVTQRRIELRLNPEKAHHKELYQAVMDVIPATGKDHRVARGRLIKSAQSLLRQEWLRLKAEAGEWGTVDENARSVSSPKSDGPS